MLDFLTDSKTLAALCGALVTVLVQVAARHGIALAPDDANHLTLALSGIFGALIVGHSHVEAHSGDNTAQSPAPTSGTSVVTPGKTP